MKNLVQQINDKLCTTSLNEITGKPCYTFTKNQLYVCGALSIAAFSVGRIAGSSVKKAYKKVTGKQ